MQLRRYQEQALGAVREAYRAGHRSVLVVMPTGTGKTVLFAEIARLAVGPVLVLAHRQELVEQAREKISAWCDDVVAVEMAEQRGLTGSPGRAPKIAVASVQTMARRLGSVPRDAFKLVVVDEAHHSTAQSYRDLLEHFQAWVLGVTATPDRADRVPLGEVFDAVAFEYDMPTAIRDGWLVPVRSFTVRTQADFSGVRKIAGELATGDVERILTRDPHLVEIAEPIIRERGERPAMVFAASVAHAHALCRVLNDRAENPDFAAALDGRAPGDERRRVIDRFRAGKTAVLVNCALFTEGFDVPRIALVAIARPVLSRAFYAQMVGRGTRIAPNKEDLLVLDFVPRNCRHSLVHAVDIFCDEREEVVDRARTLAALRSEEGDAVSLEQLVELARQEVEAREASVEYQLTQRDPFQAVGLDVGAMLLASDPGQHATEEQVSYLRKAGLKLDDARRLSGRQADELKECLLERKAVGLCSPRQAHQLAQLGIDGVGMYQDEAKRILAYVRKHGRHKSAEEIRSDLRAGLSDPWVN